MPLTLTITSYQRLSPGQETCKVIDRHDLTIGRAPDNDWPLPDPERFLSSHHCVIQYRNGTYHLLDTSTNGVFINHAEERVPKGQSVQLKTGDCLTLGEYELQVDVEEQTDQEEHKPEAPWPSGDETLNLLDSDPALTPVEPPPDDDLLASTQPTDQVPIPPFEDSGESPLFDSRQPDTDDLLGPRSEPVRQAPEPSPPETGGTFEPPLIPEDFDLEWGLTPSEPAPEPPPPPEPPPVAKPPPPPEPPPVAKPPSPPEPPSAPQPPGAREARTPPPLSKSGPGKSPDRQPAPTPAGDPVGAFVRGCGLQELPPATQDPEQAMELAGEVFRQMVQGLMETLIARSQIKGEFRLTQTTIRPVENNPLKFSIGVDEAVTNLLAPRGSAYMPARQAVQEGFDDLKAHQLAVMAGMQAALNDLLRRFDPDALEERLGRHSGLSSLLPGMRKARYWDLFKVIYGEIAEEARENFQERFGREFAQAYEKQIQALKNSGRR